MSNIFQALSLPTNGSVISLGPVTISARYPADTTANGKRRRNIMVKDGSGQAKMTLWGPSADLPLVDGSTVTLKGTIKKNEYPKDSGNFNLSGEGLSVDSAAGTVASGSSPSAAPAGPRLNHLELADQQAKYTVAFYRALMSNGMSKEEALLCSSNAPQFAAQWFFGEKSLSLATEEVDDDEPSPF